ncbi:hypothetical protein [Evansella tamaricis]|uniref:Uncharacterized protein n=1 Tax=Evansella tamaricis TaxID=2069301 RepID=A0ABS6JB75_9BACI|nr:hypothetical protein [Evansella tamaricis]MBU9710931.1 hypothetical protein [Evansella tamaricis]
MNQFTGSIFSGEVSTEEDIFYLTQVRNLATHSTLTEAQLEKLYSYLLTQSEQGSCTITVNDQIPILLNSMEVQSLLEELDTILESL